MKNKDELKQRFKVLYLLCLHMNIKALTDKIYQIGIMIDNDNPTAMQRLLFYEKNIVAIMENEPEIAGIPTELFSNLCQN